MDGKGLTAVLAIIALLGVAAVYDHEGIVDLRVNGFADVPERERVFDPTEEATPEAAPDPTPDEPEPEADESEGETAEPAGPAPVGGYGVTASHPLAVQVGMEVLEEGGNAVDAAIAVSYALGVVEPFGSGIGGGGVMLVHPLGDDPIAYNYRETAPVEGEPGFLGIGVPGFVMGMEEIHADHATFPLRDLIAPAIKLADEGVAVSDFLTERLEAAQYRMPVDRLPHFYPDGVAVAPGTTLLQPELADSLRTIAEGGSEEFYEGPITERIGEEVEGLLPEDFADYEVERTEPAGGPVGDYQVWSAPPPMTGVTLIQILQMAEAAQVTERDDADALVVLAGILQAAEDARDKHVGDPRLVDVPMDELTDPGAAAERVEVLDFTAPPEPEGDSDGEEDQARLDGSLELAHSGRTEQLAQSGETEELADSGETEELARSDTTHIVVVDRDGTMVSATNTLSNFFGSGQIVDGFFMNDQLSNFSDDPASPNLPEPGKRARSFITPTIVADHDRRPLLGIGSPGGNRIPTLLSHVLLPWIFEGASLEEAVAAPRFVVDLRTGVIIAENSVPGGALSAAREHGYAVEERPATQFFGGVQALLVDYDEDELVGVADERRDGTWEIEED